MISMFCHGVKKKKSQFFLVFKAQMQVMTNFNSTEYFKTALMAIMSTIYFFLIHFWKEWRAYVQNEFKMNVKNIFQTHVLLFKMKNMTDQFCMKYNGKLGTNLHQYNTK